MSIVVAFHFEDARRDTSISGCTIYGQNVFFIEINILRVKKQQLLQEIIEFWGTLKTYI